MSDPRAGQNEPTAGEFLVEIGKFYGIAIGLFAAAVLVLTPPALLWPEYTMWVLTEDSGWKFLAAAASFGMWLILGAAAFVLKYIPVAGTVLASMTRAAFLVFVVLLFIFALPGLLVLGHPIGVSP